MVQKSLMFMRLHGVFLGNRHAMWSKPHNGKVRTDCQYSPWSMSPLLLMHTCDGGCGGSQRVAADLGWGFHLVCKAKISRDEVN
jgi:hypothetical protein